MHRNCTETPNMLRTVVISILILFCSSAWADDRLSITALDLASLRDIGGHASGSISVSPDGQWVVFQLQTPSVTEGTYELSWITISTIPGGRLARVADGGDVILNPSLRSKPNGNRPKTRAQWSPDSKQFAYLVRRDGRTQIWHSRPERAGQTQLTYNDSDVIDFTWSRDGSNLYFETGLSQTQVLKHLEEEGKRGFLFDDRFWPRIAQRPVQRICGVVDRQLITVGLVRHCKPKLWIYDFNSPSERLATTEEAAVHASLRQGPTAPEIMERRSFQKLRQWGEFDHRYAWLENEDPETYAGPYAPLRLHALVDGEIRRCDADPCRGYNIRGHQDLWWRLDGQEVIFLRRDGASHSQTGLYAWSPATGNLRVIFQSDDWLSDCELAKDRLICLYESWTRPRRIVSVSLEDSDIATLYDPNPEFSGRRFSQIEKLEWEDDFGNASHGHLVYPIDYKPERIYPLVIVTYQSRGFLRGGVGDEYPIHPLAAEGFFVLGHEMPLDMELVAKEPEVNIKVYEDLYIRKSVLSSQEMIVRELMDRGLADPKRIAIAGLSEGSSQTTYALIHSDLFATAISSSGARKSPSTYYLMNEQTREYWRRLLNGSPDDPNASWRELSIGPYANRVDAPFLINVSDEELLGTLEAYARLQDARKPVEMYVFPDEYHIKWRSDHSLAIYRRNIQWLKFWLMGETERDPVAPGQYERWKRLCALHIENLRSSTDRKTRKKANWQSCAKTLRQTANESP